MGADFPLWAFLTSLALFVLVLAELIRRSWPGPIWKKALIVAYGTYFYWNWLRDPLHRYFFKFYWLTIQGPKTVLFYAGLCGIFWIRSARRSRSRRDIAAAAVACASFLLMAYCCLSAGRMDFNPDR